jgi:hypothetical protein
MTETYTDRQPQTGVGSDAGHPRTNRLAIWSLVLAIVTLGGVGSVLGVVLGVKARHRISETGERGAGVALAGIVVGVLTTLIAIGYWILIARHFSGGGGGSGGGGTGGGY